MKIESTEIRCEFCESIFDSSYSKNDYICKNCNRFSANLYNFFNSVKFRLKEMRASNRRKKGIRLVYFGIVFDSRFQIYSPSERK